MHKFGGNLKKVSIFLANEESNSWVLGRKCELNYEYSTRNQSRTKPIDFPNLELNLNLKP